MSLLEGFNRIQLVKIDLSLQQKVERWIAAAHHKAVVSRLRRFRGELKRDMNPEPWTTLQAPMVLLLFDICNALSLTEEEQATVLGQEGVIALSDELEVRPRGQGKMFLNDRQAKALDCVQKHGKINLSTYRAICPFWSDETLRLDLADLVTQGLLIKNGRKKGTYYTPTNGRREVEPITLVP
jgi:hypothetical protein